MDRATDWKKFVALINAADENIDSNYRPRSETALALAFDVLKQYQLAEVAKAVYKLMAESPYKIKPADIAAAIGGTASDRSAEAWHLFKQTLYQHGSFDSVAFPDPAYHWAIGRMGGWERYAGELERLDDRELSFREKDFRQMYERGLTVATFDDVQGREKVPRYLMGSCERNNREGGHSLEFTPIHSALTGERLPRETLEALSTGQTEQLVGQITHKLVG